MDPNVIAIISTVVGLVGGWLVDRAQGKKTESLAATIRGIFDQAVEHALMEATGILDGIDPVNAATKLEAWAWAELAKKGITKNTAVDLIVQPLLADAIARVLAGLRARIATDQGNLDTLASEAKGTVDEFAAAAQRGKDLVKDMAGMVEVVPPDATPAVTP